ncbi:hypothetical protein DFH06DRAFT_1482516 [Mycena polygramma]|nr:hypothetical protein DFH06DRAFT_1482516 [Mycena polygramma]
MSFLSGRKTTGRYEECATNGALALDYCFLAFTVRLLRWVLCAHAAPRVEAGRIALCISPSPSQSLASGKKCSVTFARMCLALVKSFDRLDTGALLLESDLDAAHDERVDILHVAHTLHGAPPAAALLARRRRNSPLLRLRRDARRPPSHDTSSTPPSFEVGACRARPFAPRAALAHAPPYALTPLTYRDLRAKCHHVCMVDAFPWLRAIRVDQFVIEVERAPVLDLRRVDTILHPPGYVALHRVQHADHRCSRHPRWRHTVHSKT